MVDEESLEALDFMLWMAGSQRASRLTHTNQSTVIRRAREVLSIFQTDIGRSPLGWYDRGCKDLLKMERAIHQQFRFRGRKYLRLHLPFWSQSVLQGKLPKGWICNPADPSHTCENPLDLLREHVIDACILTPTQIDDSSHDLLRIELYSSTIDLTIFSSRPPDQDSVREGACVDLLDNDQPIALKLFAFLPRSCQRASRLWFQKISAGFPVDRKLSTDSQGSQLHVAFLTPEMRRSLTSPFLVHNSQPRPYRESLVVLRDNARESRFLELLHTLQPAFWKSAGAGSPRGLTQWEALPLHSPSPS